MVYLTFFDLTHIKYCSTLLTVMKKKTNKI